MKPKPKAKAKLKEETVGVCVVELKLDSRAFRKDIAEARREVRALFAELKRVRSAARR